MRVEPDERLWRGWPGAASSGYARAFGARVQDLDVDFAQLPRAELVSALLYRCVRPHDGEWDGDATWSWTLAQRLQGLLAIALASEIPPLTLVQRCHDCAELLEIQVEAPAFVREERIMDFEWSPGLGQTLRVALPTGREQRAWSQTDDLTMRAMARRLIRAVDGFAPSADWEIPEASIDALAQELEHRDPWTTLEIESQCPACGVAASFEVDLEARLIGQLYARQRQILAEIHRLASAYHWSETAILQLPAWRRRHYLAQLGAAGTT